MAVSPAVDRLEGEAPRYQPLVIVLCAVAAGITVDRFRPLPLWAWWGLAAISLTGWLPLWRRNWLRAASAALLLAAGATAASWHHLQWYFFAADDLGYFARNTAQPVCIEAVALKTPRPVPRPEPDPMRAIPAEDQVRFDVQLVGIRDGAAWRSASGHARIAVQGFLPEVRAGDRLQVFAQLSQPPRPRNPGEFDTAAHLQRDRVRSQLRAEFSESVSLVGPAHGWGLVQLLERARMHGSRLFARYLDERRSPLAAAVLLGAREQLDPERIEAFVETGTVHLLVIAGLHLGILAGVVLFLMRRAPIPRAWALLAVALFIVSYALLVDAEPPVVRAAVLVVATCAALQFGRQRLGLNALAAAALVVLAVNPADLFHAGAQLSFLCVASLIWYAPRWMHSKAEDDPLERLIAENRSWPARLAWGVRRILRHLTLVSATVWLLTLPLVMARFHLLTPIAVLLNTLVWLPMAVALVSGFALLVVGTVLPPLAPLCAFSANANLRLLEWLVTLGQRCPLGHHWVPGPEDWWLAGFYGGLGLLAVAPRLRPPRRWAVALLAGWMAAGFTGAWLRTDHQRLQCTFLAVGHGEAIVLQLPSGQTVLYDAGQMAAPVASMRSVSGFLWSRGITHLDAVVLSHGDVDHYNALPGLLERFSVGAVYVSPVMFENQNPAMLALRQAIDRARVPVREVSGGDRLQGGPDCTLEVLHPPRRGVLGTDNANSLVLSVTYRGHKILLTGDLESPGLDDVLAERPTPCDVLLVPHHGSRQGSPTRLAAWSTPRHAVISGTRRYDLRPVEAAYRAVGSRIWHTADVGAVQVKVNAEGVDVAGLFEAD